MKTRLAVLADLPGIMQVEQESFGDVGEGAMASQNTMADRIKLCNQESSGWFWVAEKEGKVCGYLVTQPVSIHPDECTSWEVSTDNGRLRGTFNESGDSILGVSLGVGLAAPPQAFYCLVACGMKKLADTKKKQLMLCSRLPSLARVGKTRNISPEMYWNLVDRHGVPRDPLLSKWYEVFGVRPYKFMPNGFLPDKESGGHGALVVVTDPFKALTLLSRHIPVSDSYIRTTSKEKL